MRMSHLFPCVAIAAALAVAGCQKPAAKIVPVEGTISLDGRPMPNLMIQFMPDAFRGTDGPLSTAISDGAGNYVLKCGNGKAGAAVGTHRVVIIDPEKKPAPQGSDEPVKPGRISFVYQDARSTPLIIQVPPEGGKIDLQLVSNAQAGTHPRKADTAPQ